MPNPARSTVFSPRRYVAPSRGAKSEWFGSWNLKPSAGKLDGMIVSKSSASIEAKPA